MRRKTSLSMAIARVVQILVGHERTTFRDRSRLSIFAFFFILLFTGLFISQAFGQHFNLGAFWKRISGGLGSFAITGVKGSSDAVADTWLVNGTDPTIDFGISFNATSYDVIIKDVTDTTTVCQVLGATSTSVAVASCSLADTVSYRIHVTAKAGAQSQVATNDGLTFTVDNTTPTTNTITGITGMSDSTTDTWLAPGLLATVNWNAFTNADSYDVEIKDSAGSVTVCAIQNTATLNLAFSSCTLTNATDYRAYVTAKSPSGFNTVAASNNGFLFSVDNTIPGTFSITGITGDANDVAIDEFLGFNGFDDPGVNYESSSGAYRYDVVIKNLAGSSTICSNLNHTGSVTAVTCTLTWGTQYRAYVKAKSTSGFNTRDSSNDGFVFTYSVPSYYPAGNFVITGVTGGTDATADSWLIGATTATVNWQAAAGADDYTVSIRNYADSADVCAAQVTTGTSYTFSGCSLTVGTSYRIRVAANNLPSAAKNALNYGLPFMVIDPGPGGFVITGATGGSDSTADDYLTNGTTVTANWSASTDASSYDVTIRNAANTADVCATQNVSAPAVSYSFASCTLSTNTSYNIKVVAKIGTSTVQAANNVFLFLVPGTVNFCPTGSATAKSLTIYDSGGSGANYANNENCNFTISPSPTPYRIDMTISSLNLANNDTLAVYDGTTTGGSLLGSWEGTTTAPGALGTAWSGNMYLTFNSNASSNQAGYVISYTATYNAAGAFSITGITGGSDSTANAYLTDNSSGVTVAWGASSYAASYNVTIRNANNTNDVCPMANTTSTSYNFAGCTLNQGSTYIAIVTAKSGSGTSTNATNSPYSFVYQPAPQPFTISGITGGSDSTQDSALENGLYATVHWAASSLQTSYDVTIYEIDGFTVKCPLVNVGSGITSYAFSSCALTTGISYKAEVIAKNTAGNTAATNSTFQFYVGLSWTPTSLTSVPTARYGHAAVWTGSQMIIWGGSTNSGARYTLASDSWSTTSTTNAPSARVFSTAVWTGSEMIVWGGHSYLAPTFPLSTGGRYNPSSNTWSATTVLNILPERSGHTAIWTGSEMIIWGGSVGNTYLAAGRKYNPTTDVWSTISTTSEPTGRNSHTAVWTGSEMLIWGGYSSSVTRTGGRYNPSSNTWAAILADSTAPLARSGHSAIWSGSEMIVWGGSNSTNAYASGGRYNPTTNTWSAMNELTIAPERSKHVSVWSGSQVLIWGGTNGVENLKAGRKYTPATDAWGYMSSTNEPSARYSASAVWTGSEMIVWGGAVPGNENTGGKYNPSTDTWTATTTTGAPAARNFHSAVWTGSEMLIWGGGVAGGGRYDPSTDSWQSITTTGSPGTTYAETAVWTGSEMLLWGGTIGGTSSNTGGKYNPTTDTWQTISNVNPPTARSGHGAVWTGTEMIVWGGNESGWVSLDTGGRYNPSTDAWVESKLSLVPERTKHTAVWTGSEMIVWGGYNGAPLSTGRKYNPTTDTWTVTSMSSAPEARYDHTAIWTGSVMVIWGGFGSSYLQSGGRYTPGTNSWVSTAETSGVPAARSRHKTVWNSGTSEMIVWGGYSGSYLNSGSRYYPGTNTWSAMTTANAPQPRADHTAVWTGTQMLVWGGYDGSYLNSGGKYVSSSNTWATTSLTVLSVRTHASAVWTGSEMIVWGGYDGSAVASGGKYNPTSDSWSVTSMTDAPSGRYYHSAVWSGSEMVVWGGFNGSTYTNTGAKYTPGSDSWVAMSVANIDARTDHTAIWTGSEMIVWGGQTGTGSYVNSGGKYNPTTDAWTYTSTGTNVPGYRTNHTAIWTGSEMIIWGGYYFGYLNTGGRYNPSSDSWSVVSTGTNVPQARRNHTAVWDNVHNEMIVWGGVNGSGLYTGGRYDPSTNTWSTMNTFLLVSRSQHSAVWTGSDMIVWGGTDGSNLNSGAKYNAAGDSWSVLTTTGAPSSRYDHTAIWDDNANKMIVWGGRTSASSFLGDGAIYDPSADSWSSVQTTGAPSARAGHTAVWNSTADTMIIWGGQTASNSYTNTGYIYNPAGNSWSAVSTGTNVPGARGYHTAVWTGTVMVIYGGRDNISTAYNTGGRYTYSSDTWQTTKSSGGGTNPTARAYHIGVWTGSEMIVWGGYDGATYLNTGYRYNVGSDSWTATPTNGSCPTGRAYHTGFWDSGSGTMVVWGGYDGTNRLNTGGKYTPGGSWAAISTGTNVPAGRQYHTAILAGTEMIVFGGSDGSDEVNTGGRYNISANTWAAMNSGSNVPTARYYHTAVWSGSEMIVWGGYPALNTGAKYNPTSDTWTTITTSSAPTARYNHSAIWTGSVMIVWGGESSGISQNTGGRYTPGTDSWVATSTGTNVPAIRRSHTAIWNATNSEMIIWGGYDGTNYLNTGARYLPGSDSWTTMNTGPSGRYGHTAVWNSTTGEMIVWGGLTAASAYANSGSRYNRTANSWTATAMPNPPAARGYHSAIWSGTEMIIFGGYNGSSYLNTGGRYTPSNDNWVWTSTGANVPPIRHLHSAVWDNSGSRMIIWGGKDASTYLNTGGRYYPATDTWEATQTSGAPTGRYRHSTIWTGTKMIVWGGLAASSTYTNTGGAYTPSSDSWSATQTTGAPTARQQHTAVYDGTNTMIIWGGENASVYENTGGRYNISGNSWSATNTGTNVPAVRSQHVAVWDTVNSRMIVFGGFSGSGYLGTYGKYDPVGDAWTANGSSGNPVGRRYHTAIWTGTEMIIHGGQIGSSSYTSSSAKFNPTTDIWAATAADSTGGTRYGHTAIWTGTDMLIWGGLGSPSSFGRIYNPSSDSWTSMSSTGQPAYSRRFHTAIWNSSAQKMIVWGGEESSSLTAVNTGGQYDYSGNSWTLTSVGGANQPIGRDKHSMVLDSSGNQVLIWGGNNYDLDEQNSGAKYNYATDAWTAMTTTNAPTERVFHSTVWTGSNMIVFGGQDYWSFRWYASGGKYSPTSDTWTSTSYGNSAPEPRSNHAAVWTGTEMIVWGGIQNATYLNSGGRYNPSANSWSTTSTGANVPSPRQAQAVWVPSASAMVVWGGYDLTYLDTGGRYYPATNTWASTSTGANVPVARSSQSMVWDATNSRVIIWGGYTGVFPDYYTNTGAKYDPVGDAWTAISTTSAPSARTAHSTIWTGTEMIVWGGMVTSSGYVNTGGKYNSSSNTWSATSVGPNTPIGRRDHTAIWDSTDNRMIIWGGHDGTGALNSGASFDPATDSWTATASGANLPSVRYNHTAVWNAANNEMIIWGGHSGSSYLNTGARYNIAAGTWQTMSTGTNVPSARMAHTAVWNSTNNEMIIWGGENSAGSPYYTNTGARYLRTSDSWIPTSTGTNVPSLRKEHTAVWTGSEMIVWGGYYSSSPYYLNTGGKYNPITDSWNATSVGVNVPVIREDHTAVWTGSKMIIWGGVTTGQASLQSGGVYSP